MINRLEAVDCVFGYRQRRANKSVLTAERLIFESGDFCVLYGRNGAGKSTVLRTCSSRFPEQFCGTGKIAAVFLRLGRRLCRRSS